MTEDRREIADRTSQIAGWCLWPIRDLRLLNQRLAAAVAALLIATAALLSGCAHNAPPLLPSTPLPAPAAPPPDPPAKSIDEARALHAAGKLAEYEQSLTALASSPDAVVARRATALLGLYDVEQKRWDAAFDTLSKAASLDPAVAPFLQLRLIDVEENRGNARNAATIALQIIAAAPDSSAAAIARIRLPALYAQAGDTAGTEGAFAQAMAAPIDELTEEELVNLAANLDKSGRRDLATELRMRLLTKYPQGRFTEKTYGELSAVPASPLDSLSFDDSLALAERLVRDDRYDQAFDLLARIERRFPEEAKKSAYRNLDLRALFGSRNYTELLNETANERLDAHQMLLRARAAWRVGQPDLFLNGLREIEHEFPSSDEAAEAKVLRAKYYVTDVTDYEKSVADLRAAIDDGDLGKDGENLWQLGWTYYLWGHYADALAAFDDYVRRYPDGDYTSNALFWSGKIFDRDGRLDQRDAKFRELIAEYPYSYFAYRAKEIAAGDASGQELAGSTGTADRGPQTADASRAAAPVPPLPPGEGGATPLGMNRVTAQSTGAPGQGRAAASEPAQSAVRGSRSADDLTHTPPASTAAFPDIDALIASVTDPRVEIVKELQAIDLPRDASREMKRLAAAYPDNLGLQFMLADVYVRGGEPFKANGILQSRFRDFVRHGGVNIPQRFWEILFPLNYWPTITAEAQKRGVDPYLMASIIRQESGFEPSTVSNAGAVGLMQIMPAEAQVIGQRAGIDSVTRESLFHPMVNIAIGVAEFAQKLADLHGNPILAIAAYNAGEEAVGKWLAHTPIDDIDLFVEAIPYAETRLYVKTVVRNRFEYRRIYESSVPVAPSP